MATQMTTSEIEAQGATFNRENGDTQIAIVNHDPSGDQFAIRWVSVWTGNECVGFTISDVIGPLHHTDVRDQDGVYLGPTDGRWANVIDALDGADALEDVDWAREQSWIEVLQIQADSPEIKEFSRRLAQSV